MIFKNSIEYILNEKFGIFEETIKNLENHNKITLKNGEVLFDENDQETKELLDQYLEIPGKI
jgi:hypothetical protein